MRIVKFFYSVDKNMNGGNIETILYIENNDIKKIRYFDAYGKEYEDLEFMQTSLPVDKIDGSALYTIHVAGKGFENYLRFTKEILDKNKLWPVFDKKYNQAKLEEKFKKVKERMKEVLTFMYVLYAAKR